MSARPGAGSPRPYRFPRVVEQVTAGGLRIVAVSMPQRPLISVQLLLDGGASGEGISDAGTAAMLARLLPEGGDRHDADALVEAAELYGASIGAEAGWDRLSIGASLPASRLSNVLDLIAEIALAPRIPEREVERGKALRLAAIEQANASPRARASEALIASIYDPAAAYGRPLGGTRSSVAALDRAALVRRHEELIAGGAPLLIIAGEFDLTSAFSAAAASPLASLRGTSTATRATTSAPDQPAAAPARGANGAPRLLLLDRPGSVQSELRIGRIGRSRLDPGFHAALVHAEIVGGLFGSRLNRVLREEKGYTYGAAAGFDFRRGRGPFTARTAVETSVTAAALAEARRQVSSPLTHPVTDEELTGARDYLRGTFPLRFGAPSAVSGTVGGLLSLGIALDELDRYRDEVAAVDVAAVTAVASALEQTDERLVVVGDAASVAEPLRAEGFEVEIRAADVV